MLVIWPAGLAQLHDRAGVLARREDGGRQHGLVDVVDALASGSSVGLSTSSSVPSVRKARRRRGRGGDEGQVELPLQALPHDLHVQQPEEAAANPKPSAWEVSGSKVKLASLSLSLSSASRRSGSSSPSIGYRPQKTIGLGPGSRAAPRWRRACASSPSHPSAPR